MCLTDVNVYKIFIDLFSQGIVKEEHKKNNDDDKELSDYLQCESDDLVKKRRMKIDIIFIGLTLNTTRRRTRIKSNNKMTADISICNLVCGWTPSQFQQEEGALVLFNPTMIT